MSILDDILAEDAAAFVDADLFMGTETVVYTPKGGSPRTISANVFRDHPQKVEGNVRIIPLAVFVRNHATLGASEPINRNGDRVTVARVRGGTAEVLTVVNYTADAGGFMLELR